MCGRLILVALAAALSLFVGPTICAQAAGSGHHDLTGPIRLDWVARYDGPMSGVDRVASLALSPDGSTVFVTGESYGPDYNLDFLTIAYDAATGQQRWQARYDGLWRQNDSPTNVVVSPDGSLVFVSGTSTGYWAEDWDYQTVAYDATTGLQQWETCYHADRRMKQWDSSLAIAPNGLTLFLTGVAACENGTVDGNVTVAYHALTGAPLWTSCFRAPLADGQFAARLAVSADSHTIFVSGTYFVPDVGHDYLTLAHDADTGERLWTARYNGWTSRSTPVASSGNRKCLRYNASRAIATDPNGALVFVVGESKSFRGDSDYAIVAYDTTNGEPRWLARFDGPRHGEDRPFAVAVSPDGRAVLVTGQSEGASSDADFATVAYSAVDGSRLWVARYGGPGHDSAHGIAIGEDSRTVVVAGESWADSSADWAVVAYDAATGLQLWAARYDGPISHADFCRGLALAPTQESFFVAGHSCGCSATDFDFTTAGYSVVPRAGTGGTSRPVRGIVHQSGLRGGR